MDESLAFIQTFQVRLEIKLISRNCLYKQCNMLPALENHISPCLFPIQLLKGLGQSMLKV